MADLSIDIETLSLAPTAACVQIGAVSFDPLGRPHEMERCLIEINLQEVLDRFSVDAGTLVWWMHQSDAARRRVFGALDDPPRPSLREGLDKLSFFVRRHAPERVWFLHPEFDCGVIKNLYHAHHEAPAWHYRAVRDLGTLKGLTHHLCGDVELPLFAGVQHDAVDDAIHQAEVVQACYAHLEVLRSQRA